MTEILENDKVLARRQTRRQRQGYDNTSTFSSKPAELKVADLLPLRRNSMLLSLNDILLY